jgi:hypothetical protein
MNNFQNEFGIVFGMWIALMKFFDAELNVFSSLRIVILLLEDGLIYTNFKIQILNI